MSREGANTARTGQVRITPAVVRQFDIFKRMDDCWEVFMMQMLIQVAAGSCDRNVYNERTLEYLETRHGSHPYPYPYGFITGTNAADGCCVDCYLITRDRLTAGAIVECEPVGLLLQDEDGEIDHKILACLPGQEMVPGPELLQELQTFIYAIFPPDMPLRVGPILSREVALQHLQASGSV